MEGIRRLPLSRPNNKAEALPPEAICGTLVSDFNNSSTLGQTERFSAAGLLFHRLQIIPGTEALSRLNVLFNLPLWLQSLRPNRGNPPYTGWVEEMAKFKSAKRKRHAQIEVSQKLQKFSRFTTPPPNLEVCNDPKSLQTIISSEELETTIETLKLLSEYPNIIKSRGCKELRAAVYDFRQACTTGVNTAEDISPTARITATLNDGKYKEARILLAEMRIREETPKLGALCRWVRDLDVVSGLSAMGRGNYSPQAISSQNDELLLVLDAILRVAGPTDASSDSSSPSLGHIKLQEVWDLNSSSNSDDICAGIKNGSIFAAVPDDIKQHFNIVENTPGPYRKPPNHHPAILHASEEEAIPLSIASIATSIHRHPVVPHLSLIKNVLSPEECKAIIATTELIGFLPDAPIRDTLSLDISVLAHNFYWLVDEAFCEKLWNRVELHVPCQLGGKKARGLNRRFRVYRYVPGAEYRCHIDGAWPPSGMDPVTNTYVYDSSPLHARQSSLFTFLIYLNDDFEAGETTFFLPSVKEGVLNAYPIRPVMGAVAMFPHGETTGALLHEGTGVRNGTKYIIRTDVEYDVNATV